MSLPFTPLEDLQDIFYNLDDSVVDFATYIEPTDIHR